MHNLRRTTAAVVVVAAIAVGGAAIGSAATSSSSSTTTTVTAPSTPSHGTAAHEDAEKAVTGDAAAKAKTAAVAIAGSGTAGDVTTDYQGTGYEVTVTKSDGSTVEIHLDSSFQQMQMPGGGAPGAWH